MGFPECSLVALRLEEEHGEAFLCWVSMPRYYFDTYDGDSFVPDEEGIELESLGAAKKEAQAVLPHMAKDELPDGDQKVFVVSVRNQNGQVVIKTALSLVTEVYPEEPITMLAEGSPQADPEDHRAG
jgi:hypothetical protein